MVAPPLGSSMPGPTAAGTTSPGVMTPAPTLPSLRDLLESAWHDRRRIGWTVAIILALTLLACVLVPPRYEAEASLVVLLGPEYTVRPEAGTDAVASGTLDSDQIMKAEIEILNSDDLHRAVIRAIGVARICPDCLMPPGTLARVRDAVRTAIDGLRGILGLATGAERAITPLDRALIAFDDALSVEATKDANVVTISYRHKDPVLAAMAVNTLVARYQQLRQALYSDPQLPLVERQVGALSRQLAAAEARLAAFKQSHAIANYGMQRDLLLRRQQDLASGLQDSETLIDELQHRLAALRGELASVPVNVTAYSEKDPDSRTATLQASLQDLQGRAADLGTRFLPGSRVMQDLRAQIDGRVQALAALRADRSASVVRTGRNGNWDTLDLDRARARADLTAAQAQRTTLTAQLAAVGGAIADLTAEEAKLDALSRERDVADDNYRAMVRVLDNRRMIEEVDARRVPTVRMIEAARVPLRPRSLTLLIFAAGLLFSGIGAVVTVLLADLFRLRVIAPATLERRLGIPVLAILPEFSHPDEVAGTP